MPGRPFAAVSRSLTVRVPRRAALSRLAAGAAAALLGSIGSAALTASRAVSQSATPAPPDAQGFMVIRRRQLKPDASMDELIARVSDGFVPIVREIPGFKEYFFLDAGGGAHLTISVFDDPDAARASTDAAADWATATVAEFIEGPPEVTEGWLRIHITE